MRIEQYNNILTYDQHKLLCKYVLERCMFGLAYSNNASKLNMLDSRDIHNFIPQHVYQPIINAMLSNTSVSGGVEDINRIYVNMAPAGEWYGGDFHGDDGNITFLFYPFGWDPSYGGGTSFITGETVDYTANSMVVFDAKIPHKADAHTYPGWRYTIAFKTNFKWLNEDSSSK